MAIQNIRECSVLRLTVKNHPGVMSQVCGLFSRRSYNLEGVMVRPIVDTDGQLSRMWLLLDEPDKVAQIMLQTEKLEDVLNIERHTFNDSVFDKASSFFREDSEE